MNLFERLHPVYKDKLIQANLQYPALISEVVDELERTEYITHLKYGTILDLKSFLGDISNPFDYFIESI
jgi:hypothetical protein